MTDEKEHNPTMDIELCRTGENIEFLATVGVDW